MEETIFLVEESDECGYLAKALSAPIGTEADTLEELRAKVKDAVHCHFDSQFGAVQIRRLQNHSIL